MTATLWAQGALNGKRNPLDFYPTPPDVTIAILDFLALPIKYTIWEPACGTGAMSKVIEERGYLTISTDISHAGYGEEGQDFLKTTRKADAIITNPPFKLASQFIEHAVPLANTVALLLKSQFWHAATRTPLFNKFKPAYILPLTWRAKFIPERGKSPTMDHLWCVWVKGHTETKYIPLTRPNL